MYIKQLLFILSNFIKMLGGTCFAFVYIHYLFTIRSCAGLFTGLDNFCRTPVCAVILLQ